MLPNQHDRASTGHWLIPGALGAFLFFVAFFSKPFTYSAVHVAMLAMFAPGLPMRLALSGADGGRQFPGRFSGSMRSSPFIYGRRASGIVTLPSACW